MKMHALSRKEKIRRNNISEKKDGMKNIIKNEKKYLTKRVIRCYETTYAYNHLPPYNYKNRI